MTIDKAIASMLLVPLLGLCIPAALYFRKLPDAGLTATEKELVAFASQAVSVTPPQRTGVYTALACPVEPPTVRTASATIPANAAPPSPRGSVNSGAAAQHKEMTAVRESLPAVSMIYSDGPARLAIIGGHVLQEGSTIGAHRVIKIEKKRVLTRIGGKDIWTNID